MHLIKNSIWRSQGHDRPSWIYIKEHGIVSGLVFQTVIEYGFPPLPEKKGRWHWESVFETKNYINQNI